MSLLPGTSAAGWASQVGNQYEVISRFAWYREPAPPSNPSKEGGLRKSVCLMRSHYVSIQSVARASFSRVGRVRKRLM